MISIALSLSPKDSTLEWLQILCVSMIHLCQYRQLLNKIKIHTKKIQNALFFYQIYCLYILKDNTLALTLIENEFNSIENIISTDERLGVIYIHSQLLYKMTEYELAYDILCTQMTHENQVEILTNKNAMLIGAKKSHFIVNEFYDKYSKDIMQYTKEYASCDLVYNFSIALIVCGEISKAMAFLSSAKSLFFVFVEI